MARSKRLGIIVGHGTLDTAYPPLILAVSAAAAEMEAAAFFTFYGMEIIKKGNADKLQVAPVGNPAIPVPGIVGILPGMTSLVTGAMNRRMGSANAVKISELLDMAIMNGVRLIGCQMTMDAMGVEREDLLDEVEIGGAAVFLNFVREDAITLSF